MKKLITAIAILISLTSYSQKISKEDSLLRIESDKYADSLFKKITYKDFSEWVYAALPQKTVNETTFIGLINIFVASQSNFYFQERKKVQPKK